MHPTRVFIIPLVLFCAVVSGASSLRQIGMVNLPGRPGFGELAFANGMLLMSHPGASSVDVFDPVHRRIVTQITGLQSPRSIAVDEQSGKVYIADNGSQSIAIATTDGWKVVDSIPLPGAPNGLLLDGKGALYWTDAVAGTIGKVDLRTKQNLGVTPLGGTPRDVAMGNQNLIYVTVQDARQIVAVDPELKVVNRLNINGSQPSGLVYDTQHNELYVAVRFAVLAVNADNGAEVSRVAAPAGVDSLWLDDASRTLYAASNGSLLMIAADGKLSTVDEIATQVKGQSVAYDPGKRMVLLPGGREGKSKLLILRPMNAGAQSDPDEAQAQVR